MPARQYIVDRCDGTSYPNETDELLTRRPPCPCCWVPPCVKWCPCILEQNPICPCALWGRVGFTPSQNDNSIRARQIVFGIGLLANIAALGLTIFSCFALSDDWDVLQAASFSAGHISPVNNTIANFSDITVDIGLRAIAADNPNTVGKIVTGFDQFCDALEFGLDRYIEESECASCEDASQSYMGSVVSSAVLTLPSIFTDVLRMYPNYDLNCQKFYGSLVAAISIILSVQVLVSYANDCFDNFYNGHVSYFLNYSIVPEDYTGDEPVVIMDFDWEAGNGLICLTIATFLKFVDVICNCIVPTPSIAHDPTEQEAYERKYGGGGGDDGDNKQLEMEEGEEEEPEEQPNGQAENGGEQE